MNDAFVHVKDNDKIGLVAAVTMTALVILVLLVVGYICNNCLSTRCIFQILRLILLLVLLMSQQIRRPCSHHSLAIGKLHDTVQRGSSSSYQVGPMLLLLLLMIFVLRLYGRRWYAVQLDGGGAVGPIDGRGSSARRSALHQRRSRTALHQRWCHRHRSRGGTAALHQAGTGGSDERIADGTGACSGYAGRSACGIAAGGAARCPSSVDQAGADTAAASVGCPATEGAYLAKMERFDGIDRRLDHRLAGGHSLVSVALHFVCQVQYQHNR